MKELYPSVFEETFKLVRVAECHTTHSLTGRTTSEITVGE